MAILNKGHILRVYLKRIRVILFSYIRYYYAIPISEYIILIPSIQELLYI